MLRSIFRMCGLRLEEHVELIKLQNHYRLVYEGGEELRITADPDRLRQEVAKLSPRDAGRLDGYMVDNRRKLEAFKPILESPFSPSFEYEHGIYHPRGGCGAVSEAMARAAQDLGAEILLEEAVEEILFEVSRAVGVRTNRGT